eukprot:g14909.t1
MPNALPKHVRLHHRTGRYRALVSVRGRRKAGPLRDTPEEAAADVPVLLALRNTSRGRDRRPTLQDGYDLLVADIEQQGLRPDTAEYYREKWAMLTQEPPKGWSTDWPLADLTADQVQRYAKRRLDSGEAGPSTVWGKEVKMLKRIVRLAVLRGLIRSNPIEKLEVPRIRKKRFEAFPAATIHGALKRIRESNVGRPATRIRDALVIEGIYLSGMRRGEFARLKVEDFDRANRRLYVDGKNRERYLPLAPRLVEVLTELAGDKGPAELLACKRHIIQKLFIRWRLRLGLQISAHKMRHSMATSAVEAGVDVFRLATLLGHADIKMTQQCFHAADEGQREALDRIAKHQGHAGSSDASSSS